MVLPLVPPLKRGVRGDPQGDNGGLEEAQKIKQHLEAAGAKLSIK